ncbi:hypothetical protein [Actinocorallia populi]|uniref:hypothetical protein n=1 Tax=Actinocorallia populi TaxID=2079200 RepID=UPI000D08A130|nr:hypothetical protein [Actinocorallia populi]
MTPDEPEAVRGDVPADATRQDPGGPRRPLDAYGRVPRPAAPPEDERFARRPGQDAPRMWDPATAARRRRRSRLTSWVSIAVSLAVIGGVLLWLQARERTVLEVTRVRVEAPEGLLACDKASRSRTVRLTAALTLNGGTGEIRYRWRQSDREPGGFATAEVSAGEETLVVPLNWQVSGTGRTRLTGTFEVSAPSAREASASFEYSCR